MRQRYGTLSPSEDLVGELAWFTRDVLRLERCFSRVTVKRRRNLERPVRRRRSAFRDPMICIDFLLMAWLGATRLSHIASHLRGRPGLAQAFGLPRFCDPRRSVGRTGRRRDLAYRWAVAWCAGEGVEQSLEPCDADAADLVARTVDRACAALGGKPRLVRLTGPCVSIQRLRAMQRSGLPFVARATWPWALAHRSEEHPSLEWRRLGRGLRALDLGVAPATTAARLELRTVLVERPAPAPGLQRERLAVVSSLADEDAAALVRLSSSMTSLRGFFGHPRWPLGDGKLPSGDPRGNAAYLWLATIAMNVLVLFKRHLGEGESLAQIRADLRLIPGQRGGVMAGEPVRRGGVEVG